MQKPRPMKQFIVTLIAAGLSLLPSACGGNNSGAQAPSTPAAPPTAAPRAQTVTFSQLESSIFGPKCVSCHQSPDGKDGVNLDSYDGIQNAPSTHGHAIVEPGNSAGSHLLMEVQSGDMPPDGAKLSADEISQIASWIDSGALNN